MLGTSATRNLSGFESCFFNLFILTVRARGDAWCYFIWRPLGQLVIINEAKIILIKGQKKQGPKRMRVPLRVTSSRLNSFVTAHDLFHRNNMSLRTMICKWM